MTKENKKKIFGLLSEVTGHTAELLAALHGDTPLKDFGLTSIAFIQFVVALEDEFLPDLEHRARAGFRVSEVFFLQIRVAFLADDRDLTFVFHNCSSFACFCKSIDGTRAERLCVIRRVEVPAAVWYNIKKGAGFAGAAGGGAAL